MADRKSSLEYCEVGLGLNMQMQPTTTESSSSYYPYKRTMVMLPPATQQPSSEGTIVFNGYDEDGSSNFVCGPSLSDLYYAAPPTSSWPDFTTSFNSSGAVFTASQRQEFERQAMIYKYMMASVPVPSQLLPKNQFSGPISQTTTSVLDLRFSNSADPEPWRCRRTDGKKWRCSRNAMPPSQKYCERHAHKSKARSRKPVEIHQSHQANITTNNNNSSQPNVFPVNTSTSSSSQPLRKPINHLPLTGGSPVSYNQTRGGGIELFTKGGLSNHQWQHPLHSSSGMELSRNNLELNKEQNCNFQVQHREDNNLGGSQEWENRYCNSNLDSKMAFLNANTTQTTRHFIDAMSTGEKRGLDKVCEKEPVNSSRKLPFSSLTLSMPGVNEIDREDHHENRDTDTTGMMMMGLARNGQWMNPVTWMDATPGGPLGEAMCLGSMASSAKGRGLGLPSPHGYSNSPTTTSNCSRSSCEDGSQAHNFIG